MPHIFLVATMFIANSVVQLLYSNLQFNESVLYIIELLLAKAKAGCPMYAVTIMLFTPTVQLQKLSLWMAGALIKVCRLSIRLFQPFIRLYRPSVQVYESLIQVYGPSVQVYESSVQVYERSVQVYGPSVQVYEPFVELYESSVQVYEPFVELYGSSVQVYESSVQLYEPSVQVYERSVQVHEPSVQVYGLSVKVYQAVCKLHKSFLNHRWSQSISCKGLKHPENTLCVFINSCTFYTLTYMYNKLSKTKLTGLWL